MKTCARCSAYYPDALEYCLRDGEPLPRGDAPPRRDPLLDVIIDGRYLIKSVVGEGGMGMVYAAHHTLLDKRVAVKVLRREAARDQAIAQRFLAEAKAASRVSHRHIVDILDFGILPDGHAYLAMELLDGPTLTQVIQRQRPLPLRRAVRLAGQIARGLFAAHSQAIIHRDLKPDNIFVLGRDDEDDLVKIVDFGIAKDVRAGTGLTAVGTVLGTPEYMAPEQATGQAVDHRADQYAVGCILYEMLTGEVPFPGENGPQVMTQQVFDPVPPPSRRRPELPRSVERIVLRMLRKRPAERFPDMEALAAALQEVEAELTEGDVAPPTQPPPAPRPRRMRVLTAALTVMVLVMAAAALWHVMAPMHLLALPAQWNR